MSRWDLVLVNRQSTNKEKKTVEAANPIDIVTDRGGRRLGEDRRRVTILQFLPDRRSGFDRRMTRERRNRDESEYIPDLKRESDRFMEFANTQKGVLFGFLLSLPVWALILFWILSRGHLNFL